MQSKITLALIAIAAAIALASCSSSQKLRLASPKGPALTVQAESGYQFTISRDAEANVGSYQSGNIIYTPKDKNMKIASGVIAIKNTSGSELPRITQSDVYFLYLPPGAAEAKAAEVDLNEIHLRGEKEKTVEEVAKMLDTPGYAPPKMKPGELMKYSMKALHAKDAAVFALFIAPSTYIRLVTDPAQAQAIDAAFERFKGEQGFIAACSILPYPEIEAAMKANGYTMGTCNARGVTPLIAAIASGNASAVDGFLAAGANPREKTHYRMDEVEAIHVAAIQGSTQIIDLLAKKGADIAARSSGGCTPLGYAVAENKLEAVKRLCSLGADPASKQVITNSFNPMYTPLEYATKRNLNEIRDYLAGLAK